MYESDLVCILIARIVEMYELLQALNVAVVKESLLEVGPGGFGSRTLWRCQCHVARRNHLHLAVDRWRVLPPTHVRVGAGTEPPPEENPESPISVFQAPRIGSEPVGIPPGLLIKNI